MKCEACGHENAEGARFCAGCGALMPSEAQGEDPLIGQVIGGRYRITGVLGEGGMGVVYVGEQQMGSTVRKVAVKTLHPHLSKDPSVLARFHRECGTVAQLEHPNTIKFYDFGATADGTLYIAMEFVKGTSVDRVIEQSGAQSPERVLKIMKQICGALDEAHQQGIIHRDLKPENIVLTSRAGEADTVKVLDFGIAARSESADAEKEQKLTQQGMVLGTPPYMSPEQFTGKALDRRSDIYSLGVVAYELLTGRLPFEADTPWQWATQHMTAQPIPLENSAPSSNLPPHMARAIMRALSKDREQRQSSAQEFYSELSGGGGLTIDEPVVPSLASAGTAAMPAVPDFGAGAAPVNGRYAAAAAPAMGAAPVAPMGAAVPMGVPAMAAAAPGPSRPGGGAMGKWLIVGLAGLGALVAIAFVVVLIVTLKPEDEPDEPLANPFASETAEAKVAPLVESPTPSPTDAAELPTATSTAATKPPPKATASATSAPTATRPPSTATPPPTSTSPPSSQPSGKQACKACIQAARSGNTPAASGHYQRCDDASMKAQCSSQAKRQAPQAAKTAAFNGNCGQARAIISSANAMGAGSPRLDAALNNTSCR
jgi:predicted Ser/Thr protein kinase